MIPLMKLFFQIMSESTLHRELVTCMANYVKENYSNFMIVTDLQEKPGDDTPPNIDGYRPDLFATLANSPDFLRTNKANDYRGKEKHYIIGEAKTSGDLKTKRSEMQISSFLSYLNNQRVSSFILSVPYQSGDEAKSRLNFWCKEFNFLINDCIVFDQCDCWRLEDSLWHLS